MRLNERRLTACILIIDEYSRILSCENNGYSVYNPKLISNITAITNVGAV